MNEKNILLQKIRALSFALLETNLYLNAYPDNCEALSYFTRTSDALSELTEEYESKYGPLTVNSGVVNGKWAWTCEPWPWESEACR